MKRILQLEEAAQFAASLCALWFLKAEWWAYPLLLLGPDVSMIGYLAGPAVGAAVYNFFHHKGLAAVIIAYGLLASNSAALTAGIILFGHSAMDRSLGYGLKYPDRFEHTHLGSIGRNKHHQAS